MLMELLDKEVETPSDGTRLVPPSLPRRPLARCFLSQGRTMPVVERFMGIG